MNHAAMRLLWAALAAILVAGPTLGCNHDDDDDDDAPPTDTGGNPPPGPPPPAGSGFIELAATAAEVAEAAGDAILIVRRSGGSSGRVSVNWEIHAVSTETQDYNRPDDANRVVVWNDGEMGDKQIVIPIVDDTSPEGDEKFMVFIGTNVGAPIQGADGVEVTLKDDDGGTGGVFQFNLVRTGWDERNSPLRVTVSRTAGAGAPASVSVRLQDQTTQPSDYVFASPTVLSFADGQMSQDLDIPIVNDAQREGNESFDLILESPSPGSFVGSQRTLRVDLFDDDHPGVISFTQSQPWPVNESSGSVTLTVQRFGGTQGTVTVQFTATDITATAGQDYTMPAGNTLTWTDQDTTDKTITITIVADAQAEGTEDFIVTLGNPTGGAELGTDVNARVRITDP